MQKITVCGDNSYPPFEFLQEDGVFKGFNVDILNSIACESKIKIEFIPKRWEDAIKSVKNGNCHAIQGMSLSDKRSKYFDFSIKYLTVFHSLFALKMNIQLDSLAALSNVKVAIQKGDVCYDLIKKRMARNIPLHIVLVDNQEIALQKLFSKEVQAVTGNNLTITYLADKMKKNHLLKVVGDPLKVSEYCIAVKKRSPVLLDLFNNGINSIMQNSVYKDIHEKWFGKEIDSMDAQILESVEAGVVCINNFGDITAINNSACEILNIPKEELISRSFFETPLKNIFTNTFIQETLRIGKSFLEEVSYINNSKERFLNLNISPLLDHQNHILGAVLNFRDITNEKKLEQIVITRDKMKSLGSLILNIAHEIRNPLTSIKNFIDLIPTHLEDKEFRLSLLHHVPKQIKIIDDFLKELLEYSKPRNPVIKPQNVKELIDSIIKLIHNKNTINFIIKISDNFSILADENHLRQILFDIIINSMEALNEGGTILIEGKVKSDDKVIIISDNGHGINKESLPHIYEPFYTTKESGTGLGLYIVYRLVKDNHGSISIDSDKNGTKVILTFH